MNKNTVQTCGDCDTKAEIVLLRIEQAAERCLKLERANQFLEKVLCVDQPTACVAFLKDRCISELKKQCNDFGRAQLNEQRTPSQSRPAFKQITPNRQHSSTVARRKTAQLLEAKLSLRPW